MLIGGHGYSKDENAYERLPVDAAQVLEGAFMTEDDQRGLPPEPPPPPRAALWSLLSAVAFGVVSYLPRAAFAVALWVV